MFIKANMTYINHKLLSLKSRMTTILYITFLRKDIRYLYNYANKKRFRGNSIAFSQWKRIGEKRESL